MTMNNPKKRRLGRGLEALLGSSLPPDREHDSDEAAEPRILPLEAHRTETPRPASFAPPSSASPTTVASFGAAATVSGIAPHTAVPGPRPASTGASPAPGGSVSAAGIAPNWNRPSAGASTTQGTLASLAAPTRPTMAAPSDEYDAPTVRVASTGSVTEASAEEGSLIYLSVDRIVENPFQPRREFSEPELASLSESLKEHDMLQPILVRRIGDGYQIISGERRWRAAQMAGWTRIPARIRQADDRLVAELAIVENLQRKDLNAVEKALSFRRYLEEHDSTQEELANRLKIDRSTIANLIRILDLPEVVQDTIRTGGISAGHARALLPLGNAAQQIEYCQRVQRESWSVRETERRVMETVEAEEDQAETEATGKPSRRKPLSPQIQALEQQLRRALGTSVEIRTTARGKGKIVIHFRSNDEFIRIRERLTDDGSDEDLRRVG